MNHNVSRFATRQEANSAAFRQIRKELYRVYRKLDGPDLSSFNRERFPWADPEPDGPEFYASRYWEYPWALIESEVAPGMKVLDVGCGWSPFIFLLAEYGCECYGIDPMLGEPSDDSNFGVPEHLASGDVRILKEGMEKMSFPANHFDRVYCFSVIEHIRDLEVRRTGMREMARVLKPGGLLVVTVDYVIDEQDTTDFYDLISASGLVLYGGADFCFPRERFCIYHQTRSEDVFGFILHKDPRPIHTRYVETGQPDADGEPIPMYYERLVKHFEFLDDPELIKRAEWVKGHQSVIYELENLELYDHEVIRRLRFVNNYPASCSELVNSGLDDHEVIRRLRLVNNYLTSCSELLNLGFDDHEVTRRLRLMKGHWDLFSLDDNEVNRRLRLLKKYLASCSELENLGLDDHEVAQRLKLIKDYPTLCSYLTDHPDLAADLEFIKKEFGRLSLKANIGLIPYIIWKALRGKYNLRGKEEDRKVE